MAFQVGNKEADVSVEFPNLLPEGDPASPMPVESEIRTPAERQPLNDYVDDRNNTYSIEEFLRRRENPKAIDVSPAERGNKIAQIPDYSHLVETSGNPDTAMPDYSHLVQAKPDTDETFQEWKDRGGFNQFEKRFLNEPPSDRNNQGLGSEYGKPTFNEYNRYKENPTEENLKRLFDTLEKGKPKDGIPTSDAYKKVIGQVEEMQKNIWNDPQYYPLIKKFMETGDPIDAFKAAAAITMLTFGAAPGGSVGSSGGKPPYFKKPANENVPSASRPGELPIPDPYMVNTAADALYSSQTVVQRVQQQTQRLRQEAIKSGTIAEKGSIVKEMESTLKRLKLDQEAHEIAGVLSKGDLRELSKEITSVEEMLSVMKSKSGKVLPIDHKEMMQETKSQEPQAMDYRTKGVHFFEGEREIIRTANAKGSDAKEIATLLTMNRKGAGLPGEVPVSRVENFIKAEGLVTPYAIRKQAIRDEVRAQDVEIMGKQRSQQEIHEAVQAKYPEVTRNAVNSLLDRQRALRKSEAAMAEKYGVELKPKVMAQQQKSGESIFKPVGQGEFDFHAIEKPTLPRPDLEQAKREMKFAQDTFAKFNQSILKGSNPSKEVLEENRLRGLLYDRTKDLHATVKQIDKDEKSGSVLGKHAREYLESRVQAYLEQIKDLKERIWNK